MKRIFKDPDWVLVGVVNFNRIVPAANVKDNTIVNYSIGIGQYRKEIRSGLLIVEIQDLSLPISSEVKK